MRAVLAAHGTLIVVACSESTTGVSDAALPDAAASDAQAGEADAAVDASASVRPWIDTHAHSVGIHSACNTQACVDAVVATMDTFGVKRTILLHPPSPSNTSVANCEKSVRDVVALRPDRFFLGAGGCELNSKIQATVGTAVTQEIRDSFGSRAQALAPGAVAFGEMAALHVSYEAAHAFEEITPNAKLFQDLADIAATQKIAVDLHMDAVKQTMTTPSYFTSKSPNNPAQLQGNTDAFSQLLAHNRGARFVWAHVGRDTTGDMTPTLVDAMLAANTNLFIQIHPTFAPLKSTNAIVADETFAIRADWLDLLKKYPDRAVLGTDVFFTGTETDAKPLKAVQLFLQGLPVDLATKIGCVNPVTIYGLPGGC